LVVVGVGLPPTEQHKVGNGFAATSQMRCSHSPQRKSAEAVIRIVRYDRKKNNGTAFSLFTTYKIPCKWEYYIIYIVSKKKTANQ